MRKGKLGKVFVRYGEPIDLTNYIEKHNSKESVSLSLTRDLYKIHQQEQPITMNSLISSSLMYYPNQEISFKNIKTITKNIYNYILDKDIKHYCAAAPQNYEINQTVLSLGFNVKGNPIDRKRGDDAIVNLKEKNSLTKMLSMSYYSNQIGAYFSSESIIIHAMGLIIRKNEKSQRASL